MKITKRQLKSMIKQVVEESKTIEEGSNLNKTKYSEVLETAVKDLLNDEDPASVVSVMGGALHNLGDYSSELEIASEYGLSEDDAVDELVHVLFDIVLAPIEDKLISYINDWNFGDAIRLINTTLFENFEDSLIDYMEHR